jgi:A/G-specific adenine glycosylase
MSSSGAEYPALRAFLEHNSEEYHLEGPTDEMRSALLEWYGQNRRRLPWRGDPPPYNGSTAGINSAAASAPVAPAAPALTPASPVAPVSAYGVWVSEIMCQQTRVEAVR